MRKLCSLLVLGIALLAGLYFFLSVKTSLVLPTPALLPHTTPEMKTAGFWIARHPSPDKIVLTPQEIAEFNTHLENNLKTVNDITKISLPFSGEKLMVTFEKTVNNFKKDKMYLDGGRRTGDSFYEKMNGLMNLSAISNEMEVRFGFITGFADQRSFPTDEGLYEKRNSTDFDQMQESDLDIAEPVAVVHESLDGEWYYVFSSLSDGWIKKEKVALGTLEQIKDFLTQPSFVVVTSPKADIFLNAGLTEHNGYVRMGVKFPVVKVNSDIVEILLPVRDSEGILLFKAGYVKKEDVHEGCLPYTARNTITQAFKLLNCPYGWGGKNGEQDCSRFLQEIFATVGITLPRNSKEQSGAGRLIAKFKRNTSDQKRLGILRRQAVGGTTLLQLKGHIMLLLGFVDKKPFVIHETHGYLEHRWNGDVARITDRVVVSDLSLGENSKKRSLLKRIIKVSAITKE